MRLAIDAMGNDNGPMPILMGVAQYLRKDRENTVILVGRQDELRAGLSQLSLAESDKLKVVHASEVVEMDEKIDALKRKPDASIIKLTKLLKENEADAMVACGNTSAAVAATRLGLRYIEGVHRAGIAVPMPSAKGVCVVVDMGANINVKPKHLYTYGIMASAYSRLVLGVENPRVGLLNVGEEDMKGNDVCKEAFAMLKKAPINFIGNAEGSEIFNGDCDVVVCDGFVGNVILKASEEIATAFAQILKQGLTASLRCKMGALLAKPAFAALKQRASYDQYGGAPLLGVNGVCIIGHGRSNPLAVENALRVARESVSHKLNQVIHDTLMKAGTPSETMVPQEAPAK